MSSPKAPADHNSSVTEGILDPSIDKANVDPAPAAQVASRPITATELKDCLKDKFLKPAPVLPHLWTAIRVTHWAEEDPVMSLLSNESISELLHNQPGQMTTNLEFITAGLEGKVVGYREVS